MLWVLAFYLTRQTLIDFVRSYVEERMPVLSDHCNF